MILQTDLINWTISLSSILCSVLLLAVPSSNTAVSDRQGRVLRQSVTLPIEPTTPSTECRNSVYSIGRYLQYHYICCDQTGQPGAGGGTTQCQKKKVPNLDCNPDNAFGVLNETFFNCNGTEGQNTARDRCDNRWSFLAEDTCWVWTTCYKGACEQEELNLGSSLKGFCGDGACDDTENSNECPIDCCQEENFECKVTNNTCPDICCGEPSCCMNSSFLVDNLWLYIVIGIGGFILFCNMVCCCICLCCYKGLKHCKPHFHRHRTQVPSNNMQL